MKKQTKEKWCVKVHKKVYKTLNQVEISSVDILVGIASFAVALDTRAITAGIKKYKSI